MTTSSHLKSAGEALDQALGLIEANRPDIPAAKVAEFNQSFQVLRQEFDTLSVANGLNPLVYVQAKGIETKAEKLLADVKKVQAAAARDALEALT